jgi:uncharacterized protein (DUF3820 family)
MLTATTPHEVMPFGRHKGRPIRDIPVGYVRWLAEWARVKPWLQLAASCELTRRLLERRAERAALWPLPTAQPRVVCGIELDAHEAHVFGEAERQGHLIEPGWLPNGSRLREAWNAHVKEPHA